MALADAVPFAVAHWPLDEVSGTRADSIGSNDLTDNGTVGSAAGMFGNAADFEESSNEYLSHADNATLSTGDIDFVVRCWVQLESKTTERPIVCKFGGAGSREYLLRYDNSTDRFQLFVTGSTSSTVEANNLGSPSTGVWYLIHAWHDSVNNQIGIAINAGTANTASHTDGMADVAEDFRIGLRDGGPGTMDGLVDDVVLLKGYILSADERTEDYNGGAGKAFEDWPFQQEGGAYGGAFPLQRSVRRRPGIFAPGLAR